MTELTPRRTPAIDRMRAAKARRQAEPAPPLIKSVDGVAAGDSIGQVTDVYDLEVDPAGARYAPYTELVVANYSLADDLRFDVGKTAVSGAGDYRVPAQAQMVLTGQRIWRIAVRREDTVSYRITLRRDQSAQELT